MAFDRHGFVNKATHLGLTRRQAELLADSFGSAASGATPVFSTGLQLYRDVTPQTIPNGVATAIVFDDKFSGSDAVIEPPTLPGAVATVLADGVYIVGFEIDWADSAVGSRSNVPLVFTPASDAWNNAQIQWTYDVSGTPTPTNFVQKMAPVTLPLAAGTTIGLTTTQTSGGDLDVVYAQLTLMRIL